VPRLVGAVVVSLMVGDVVIALAEQRTSLLEA
jgi:hypothetical protein